MKNPRPQAANDETTFELKASADSSGMAKLRINCMVSIPTGIRILAMIDAEGAAAEAGADSKKAAKEVTSIS
jgi:hypothetical protein